jgi:ribose transport system permease protein
MAGELTRKRVGGLLTEYLGMAAALVVLLVIFGIAAENFFTLTTFRTIANQIPDTAIAAVGMTFVLILAGIDLSVGSVLALSGAVLGIGLVNWDLPLVLAVLVCLLVGLACGAVNGLIVIRWRLPSFIVTLGMLEAARGAASNDAVPRLCRWSVEVITGTAGPVPAFSGPGHRRGRPVGPVADGVRPVPDRHRHE